MTDIWASESRIREAAHTDTDIRRPARDLIVVAFGLCSFMASVVSRVPLYSVLTALSSFVVM